MRVDKKVCLVLIELKKLSTKRLALQVERRGESIKIVNAADFKSKQMTGHVDSRINREIERLVETNLANYAQLVEQFESNRRDVHTNINAVWLAARNVAQAWTQWVPTILCFGRLPQTVYEYLWHDLAKAIKIPTIILNAAPVEGYSFCVDQLEDYGVFENLPANRSVHFPLRNNSVTESVMPRPANILLEIDTNATGLRPLIDRFAFSPLSTVESVRSKFAVDVKIDVLCETGAGNGPNDWTSKFIRPIKNVNVLQHDQSYTGCWENYDGVVTVGGPIGAAAARRGAAVITLGKPWYRMLPNVRSIEAHLANINCEPNTFDSYISDVAWPIETGHQAKASHVNSENNIDQIARCLIEGTIRSGSRNNRRAA